MGTREKIPANIKLDVRRRCGFGCVLCGSPVFDYDHMTGYAITGHDPDDITLLCPEHHREKTAGRLPTSTVRRANDRPWNLDKKLGSAHDLYFEGNFFTLELGSLRLEWKGDLQTGRALTVDGEPFMQVCFREGRLILDLDLRDADNRVLLLIRNGQLRQCLENWDVVFEGTRITVRRGPRDVIFALQLFAPDMIRIERADVWLCGVNIRIGASCTRGDGLEIVNNESAFCSFTMQGMETGIELGRDGEAGAMIRLGEMDRFYGGKVPPRGSFRK